MAHFAQLNETNTVLQVIVVSNDVAVDEQSGQDFIANVLRLDGVWKQTSYNTYRDYAYTLDDSTPPKVISVEYLGSKHRTDGTPFRGQYAGIGDIYDADLDEFVSPAVESASE
jgi:hypothetical protein